MAQLQLSLLSLFEFVPEDDFNEPKKRLPGISTVKKSSSFGIVTGLDTTTLFRDGGLIGFTRISSSRPA